MRRSCRGFLPSAVSGEIVTSVLEDAQKAPSNGNTQPWNTHIVSGNKLKELSVALLKELEAGNFTPDFTFDNNHFYGTYSDRQKAQGKAYYEGMGVARGDKESRRAVEELNWKFYNAPHAAFLFMPSFGDHVRVASDMGMYAQTFLLSLTDHGLAGIPQTGLGFFADTTRKVLNVSDEFKLLFGVSFGYADPDAPGNSIKMGRDSIGSNVTFHE
ncbi:nitroreductase [Pontibacter toksunensis]|uniref:Nitroreductase n=1 Tax=Pontibacter toksunensis TaxID=1332631 RepID=A0ABW6C005_9BACT